METLPYIWKTNDGSSTLIFVQTHCTYDINIISSISLLIRYFYIDNSIYLHDNVDPSNILLWIYCSIYMPKFIQASQNTLDKKCVAYYWICHKFVSYQKTQTLSLLLCISPYDWWWHYSTVSLLLYPLLLLQCYIIVIWPEPKHYISY